jgi:hypothetical protein
MIVRFTLTPRSLHLDGVEPDRRSLVLRRIVNHWGKFGRLVVLDGDTGKEEFLKELDSLPQDLRKLWQKVLQRFRFSQSDLRLQIRSDLRFEDFDRLAKVVDVLGHAGDEEFSPGADSLPEKPEILPAEWITDARAFLSSFELADTNLPRGLPVSRAWQQRFEPLASVARRIRIVDRYCLRGLVSRNPNPASEGIIRFFRFLQRYSGKIVNIYTSYEDREEPRQQQLVWSESKDILDRFNWELNPDNQNQFQVKVLPGIVFRDYHDRFLAFDYQVLEVGTGLEVLKGDKLTRESSLTLKCYSPSHRNVISRLESEAPRGFFWSSRSRQ